MTRVWFITGTSSGFGRALVERALSIGDRVVATLRTPSDLSALSSTYPPTQLLILPLDVTSPSSVISDAFASAVKVFGRIDIVVSNAGLGGMIGEAEIIPEDNGRAVLEVNFWGSTKVAIESIKVFRDADSPRGGLFIQISSAAGMDGYPLTSYYAASKYALEGWFEAFSGELDPKWNIKVHVIDPGTFKTSFAIKNELLPPIPAYATLESDHPSVRLRALYDMLVQGHDFGFPEPSIFVDAVMYVAEKSEKGEELSLRIPLGHDSLGAYRKKIKGFAAAVDQLEPLSKNCKFMAPH